MEYFVSNEKVKQIIKMKKFNIGLLILFGIINTTAAQPISDFPKLHITEIIQGSENDIGFWGDGNIYVIDIWGTWCAPCIKNIPELTKLQKKYKSKGLRVIGYSWEEPENVRKLLRKQGAQMLYTLVNDRDGKFIKIISEEREMVEGFPYVFVIGRKGEIAWAGNPKDGLEEFIDTFIQKN